MQEKTIHPLKKARLQLGYTQKVLADLRKWRSHYSARREWQTAEARQHSTTMQPL